VSKQEVGISIRVEWKKSLVKLINNSWRKHKRNHEREGSDTESCWFT
jgi:hypothetical protein